MSHSIGSFNHIVEYNGTILFKYMKIQLYSICFLNNI